MNTKRLKLGWLGYALVAGWSGEAAWAQGRSCQVQVTPATVRAEGFTEALPDILLQCTGGTPTSAGANFPSFTVQVTYNVPAASRQLTVSLTEGLLLLDEPAAGAQSPCTGLFCTGTPGGNNRNVFQASRFGDNGIQFANVPIDGGPRTIRLTNLRANAVAAAGQPITATLTINGPEAVQLSSQIVTMATPGPGLQVSVLNAANSAGGVPVQLNRTQNVNFPVQVSSPLTLSLRYSENSAVVFKERSVASSVATPSTLGIQATPAQGADPSFRNFESIFYNPAYPATSLLNQAGAADTGTRLIARFNNVPPGTTLYASLAPIATSGTGITARLIATDASGAGMYQPVLATNFVADGSVAVAPLQVVNNNATAVWEILDPTVNTEWLTFGVLVSSLANAPPEGEMTVTASLGPVGQQPLTTPAPRFQASTVNQSAVLFTSNPTQTGPPGGPFGPGGPGGSGGGGTPTGQFAIVQPSLPQGTVGTAYPRTVIATVNGTGPYNWSLAPGSGPLPQGMILTSNGELIGTPTQSGNFPVTLRVTDGTFQLATLPIIVSVRAPLVTIAQTVLPVQPSVGQPFGPVQLTTQGGTGPLVWSVVGSSLPPGMTLTPDGVLSGLPNTEGQYFFTIGVVDATGTSSTQAFTLNVNGILSIGTPAPLPPVTTGGLYSLLLQGSGGAQPYRWSVVGGTLPPGLTLSEGGLLQGTVTTPGLFGFTLQVRDNTGTVFTRAYTLPVAATGPPAPGTPGAPPPYTPSQPSIEVVNSPGLGPVTQTITFTNSTGTPVVVTPSVETNQGSGWLQVVTINGTSALGNPGTFLITINTAGLAPGTYTGTVILTTPDGQQIRIPVVVTVPRPGPVLGVFPGGLTFTTAAGGPVTPVQTLTVLNSGTQSTTFSSEIVYGGTGASWLSFEGPSGGATAAGATLGLNLRANAAGLAPGDYYAEVRITSTDPGLPPQSVTVVLNVLGAGVVAPAAIRPGGVLFTSRTAVEVFVDNPGTQPVTFFSTRMSMDGQAPWFTLTPASGTVQPGQFLRIAVAPATTPFNAGVRRGMATFVFSDGTTRTLDLALIAPAEGLSKETSGNTATCNASQLVPVFTVLSPGFSVNAGWPTPVEVRVADDCGAALTQGTVALAFSNRDPAVPLTSLRDGRWSGVWVGRNTQTAQVTITAIAANANASLRGSHAITGTLAANALPPVVNSGGVVSSATFTGRLPVAPGSLVSIFGSRLADRTAAAERLPLETTLANTSATLGGRSLPLLFSSDGQVNAVIPFGTATDTPQQLLIRRGNALAVPEPVTVVPAQPDVFLVPLGSETAPAVTNVNFGLVNLPQNSIRPGDAIIVFCTGLGATTPLATVGSAAPAEPLARTERVTRVTVGGVEANVVYAGLAPGFTGLYQVVAVTAASTPAGNVPVVVTTDGKSNPVVRINVQ